MSKIAVIFDVPGVTSAQYDQIISDLEAAGEGKPKGRLYSVATPKPGGFFVVDVWESAELLDQFVPILMPILTKNGVTAQPQVHPVHNIIEG